MIRVRGHENERCTFVIFLICFVSWWLMVQKQLKNSWSLNFSLWKFADIQIRPEANKVLDVSDLYPQKMRLLISCTTNKKDFFEEKNSREFSEGKTNSWCRDPFPPLRLIGVILGLPIGCDCTHPKSEQLLLQTRKQI